MAIYDHAHGLKMIKRVLSERNYKAMTRLRAQQSGVTTVYTAINYAIWILLACATIKHIISGTRARDTRPEVARSGQKFVLVSTT